MMPTFLSSLAAKIIMVVVVIAFLLLAFKSCTDGRKAGEQGKQDTRSAAAMAETAKEAAETVIEQAGEEASIDELVSQTQKEIEDATDEKGSRRAAMRAICSLPDYRGDPACKLQ